MAHRPDIATHEAQALLRLMGYDVSRVAEGTSMSCDLCATHTTGTIWVEAKRDEVPVEDVRRIIGGGASQWEQDIAVTRKVENTISRASKQLRSSAPEGSLKLLWFLVTPPNDLVRELNIHCTLYGVRWFHLTAMPPGARANVVPVFLGGRAAFQSVPDIAGAVIQSPGSLMLGVNPFHANLPALATTRLCQVFGELRSIFSLEWARRQEDSYVVDLPFAGTGEASVIKNLLERYGVVAKPTTSDASTTAWPGNEMGRLPVVPGAGRGRQALDFVLYLQGHTKADGTLIRPSGVSAQLE